MLFFFYIVSVTLKPEELLTLKKIQAANYCISSHEFDKNEQ